MNSFDILKNTMRDVDEYLSYTNASSNSFLGNGYLKYDFPNDTNIISLWFIYLSLNGFINSNSDTPNFLIRSTTICNDYNIDDEIGYKDCLNWLANYIGGRLCNNRNEIVIIKANSYYRIFSENEEFEIEDWAFETDKVVSNFIAIKNLVDKVVFVKANSTSDSSVGTKFFVFIGDDNDCPIDPFWSKFIIKILSASVRWAKPLLLKPYTDKENSFLSKLSDAVCKDSLTQLEDSNEIYEDLAYLIKQSLNMNDIRKERLRSFSHFSIDKRLRELYNLISSIEDEISNLTDELRRKTINKNDLIHQRAYLTLQRDNDDNVEFDEFLDMLFEKFIDIKIRNTQVEFFHKSLLSNVVGKQFLEDTLNSPVTSSWGNDLKTLLRAIFVDETVNLQMQSCYYIDFETNRIDTWLRDYSSEYPQEVQNCFPNPHHHQYNCIGENREYLQADAVNGDYYSVLCRLTYLTGSINLEEEPTFEAFVSMLRSYINGRNEDCKCFVLNGDYFTAKEVLSQISD